MRTKLLLSGVSAIAVLTALNIAGTASAASVTGPNPSDAFINDGTAHNVTDFVAITADATLDVDANNDSFFNNLTMLNAAGPVLTVNDSFLIGDIVNQGSMTASTGNAIDILNDSQIGGGIFNGAGHTIDGAGYGISIAGDSTVSKGILNDGTISGGTGGIFLGLNSEIYHGITNNGTITGASGIVMTGNNLELRGGITNNEGKLIEGTAGAAINFDSAGGFLRGGITNDGYIQAQGNNNNAIALAAGTVTGGITNSATGTIDVAGTTATAIFINGTTFDGSIDNSGDILAAPPGGVAISITGTTAFTGSIVNHADATISGDAAAIDVSSTSFTGDIDNSGTIASANGYGIDISATTFTGNIINQSTGSISGTGANAIDLSGATFAGDISNAGSIVAATDGIHANAATMAVTDITNTGTITADDDGIEIADTRTLGGTINNSRTIEGDHDASGTGAGINIEGQVAGGITNTGTIKSAAIGIDLRGADAATTINQNGGLIQGRNGSTITTAINLDQTGTERADIVNANDGQIDGNIVGGATNDDVIMGPGSAATFAYLRGTASGIDQFDMTGAGTAILGADARGATGANAPGVTIGAVSMTHSGAGTLYVDDNTVANLTGAYTQSNGTLEFLLTSTVATHGQINAATAALGGRIAAYIQGDTFATIGGNTFTYQNVITGTTSGNFINATDIDTNSLFFTGQAIKNASDVDIVLTRQSFTNALALPSLSLNQQAVGGALETIYAAGGYSPAFIGLFNELLSLGAGQEGEAARIYDELSGAEHADLQEVGLRVSHTFNDMIGGRLTDIRGSQHMADLGLRRYAEATPNVANDGMSAPRMRDTLGMAVWGRGYGTWTDVDSDTEAAGYDQNSGGFAGGLDFAVDKAWRIGGAIGWSSANVDFATVGDTADIDSFQFAGYGAYEGERFYGDAALSFGFHDIASTRLIDLGDAGTEVASANYDANTWGAHGEFGARFEMGTFDFEAFVGAAYGAQSTDGFAEAGASGFSLLVQDADADSLASTVGARFSGEWQAGGVRLVPKAEVAWRHEFMDERQSFSAAFLEDPATQFQIVSTALSRDSAVVGLGIGAQVSKGLVLFLDYDGLFNGTSNTHAASAGLRATW